MRMVRDMSAAAQTLKPDTSQIFRTLDEPLNRKTVDEVKRQLGTSPEEKRFLFSGAPTPEAASPVGRGLTKNNHFKDTAALT